MNRLVLLVCIVLINSVANAHFPILLTERPFVKAVSPVNFQFSFGHPYERDYVNADQPAEVFVINARGVKTDLSPSLKKNTSDIKYDGKDITAWDFSYSPPLKGSYVTGLNTAPSISRNGESLYQEYIKTVIFAERGSGWDQRTNQPLEIIALTRPFGLQPNFVFRGQLLSGDKPVADRTIYIEHFEKEVPNPDSIPVEPLVTFEVKTDAEGFFTTTLPEKGWWIVASYVDDIGTIEHEGKSYQHNAMTGIWLHVE